MKCLLSCITILLCFPIAVGYLRNHIKVQLPLVRPFVKRIAGSHSSLTSTISSTTILDDQISSKSTVPSVKELLQFGLPTLGIWLLQPILSLIDTSVIGMSAASGTSIMELAALGPGIAWIDSTAYMCQFVGMATTNLYATAISEGDRTKQRKVLSHATIIALALGILLFSIQYTCAPMMMKILAGSAKETIPYALRYSRIRSFGALIAVPTIIGQAAFLASKDSVTPLKAVLVGSVLNIVGDIYLVCYCGRGIAGAAWATMASQLGSALYLLFAGLTSQKLGSRASSLSKNSDSNSILDRSDGKIGVDVGIASSGHSSISNIPSTTAIVRKLVNKIQTAEIPRIRDLQTFLSFCGPLFFVLLVKSFLWSFTTFACSTAGAAPLAAHQIVLNIFCIFAIFGDAVSQMSQTYLPAYFGFKTITKDQFSNGQTVIQRIMKISFVTGVLNCILAFLAVNQFGPKLFTKSKEVNAAMVSIVVCLAASIFPNTLMAGLEGVLIATRDVTFHWLTYLVTGIIMLTYQSTVRAQGSLIAVWKGIVAFQWLRVAIFSTRVRRVLITKRSQSY